MYDLVELTWPGATEVTATAINSRGDVCGYAGLPGRERAVLWRAPAYVGADISPADPPTMRRWPVDLNSAGQMIGFHELPAQGGIWFRFDPSFPGSAVGTFVESSSFAGIASDTIATGFTAINKSAQIVGQLAGGV